MNKGVITRPNIIKLNKTGKKETNQHIEREENYIQS